MAYKNVTHLDIKEDFPPRGPLFEHLENLRLTCYYSGLTVHLRALKITFVSFKRQPFIEIQVTLLT